MGADINQQKFHNVFGHVGEGCTKKTAKFYNIRLKDKISDPCVACCEGKAKRKSIPKMVPAYKKATTAGERTSIDISKIIGESFGGREYWLLLVGECTDHCFSYFLKNKSDLGATMLEFIKSLEIKNNISVKRLDVIMLGRTWHS